VHVTRDRSVPAWVTIAVLSSCGVVASLQFTLIIPLLPELPRLVGVSPENASWLITVTLLASAVSMPIVSRMADMYGKRRMLVVSLCVLLCGSVICAVVTSFAAMLVGRAMQGFASSLIAVGISILRDELPPERISSAVALMSATLGIGAALGLPLSGVIANAFGWHAVFWFTTVAAALLTAVLVLLVPESPVRTPARFDVGGAVLLSTALIALLLPVTKGGAWGWSSPLVWGLALAGVGVLAAWIPYELRVNHPMVDLRTAVRRPVLLTNCATLFVGFAMFANMVVTTQVLQQPETTGFGLGLSVLATGLAMAPAGLAMVLLAPLSGRLLDRWGGRRTMLLGVSVMAVTYLGRVFFSETLIQVIIGSTLVGVGTAVSFAAMPTLIMSAVPITHTAAANGLNALVRSLGTSIASAAVATILAVTAVDVGGAVLPTWGGVQLALLLAAAANVIALVLTWFIPLERVGIAAPKYARERAGETVIGGRILYGGDRAAPKPSVVAVLDLDGIQLDWSRADHDGRYSVVVPGTGTYVLVANAQGWASRAQVLDFHDDATDHDLRLTEQLTVSGRVTSGGHPCAGARVALSSLEGTAFGTRRCDDDGLYAFPLPPIGRYLLTAIDPNTRSTHARKVILTLQSHVVDLDLQAEPSIQPPSDRT
jgi:MFS family permease